jgi:hypothetical protein
VHERTHNDVVMKSINSCFQIELYSLLESSCMGNFTLNWGLLLLQMLTTPYSAIEREILTAVRFLLLNVNENTHQICGPEGSDCKGGCTKRFVVKRLKVAGYSASVCKTKWPTSGRVPGGTICKLHFMSPLHEMTC